MLTIHQNIKINSKEILDEWRSNQFLNKIINIYVYIMRMCIFVRIKYTSLYDQALITPLLSNN